MAYRNTIISFASLIALGTACSKAPSYNTGVQSAGTDQVAAINANGDHGPMPQDDVVTDTNTADAGKTETPAATKPAETPAATPAAPAAVVSDAAKKIANKAMFNMVNITAAKAWGTTAANRLKVQVAVDAAGAVIPPQAGLGAQLVAKIDPTDPNKIALTDRQGAAVVLNTLTSFMVACNNSGANIYLHSGTGGAPFSHGSGAIATGTCAAFPAQNLRATDGATYDHIAGQAAENNVFIAIEKIGPDGKVVP